MGQSDHFHQDGFFIFYSLLLKMDKTSVISPFHGKLLNPWFAGENEEEKRYFHIVLVFFSSEFCFARRSLKLFDGKQWKNQHIFVQDLFRRDVNVGAGISEQAVESFRKAMEDSVTPRDIIVEDFVSTVNQQSERDS